MSNKFRILDLFSGAGGFSLGFDMVESFSTVLAVDFDKSAINTFQNNFKKTKCICGNISDYDTKKLIIQEAIKKNVNMIIGGPPCQGFSLKGKNLGMHDKRNYLFLEYMAIVKAVQPKIFVIENVKNMISSSNGFFIKQIYENFISLGYNVTYGILNSVNFGVPQNRERAIVVGIKGDLSLNINNISKDLNTFVTVRDAIFDLSYLNSGEGAEVMTYSTDISSDYQRLMRTHSNNLYNHRATNHSKFAVEKMNMIPPEGDKSSLPKELHGKQQFSTTWSRLMWDKPSPTIDTRFDTPSNGRNIHPYLNRSITPREAARLQSFPDDFIFYGNKTSICKQIGNAVPPLMAKAIAKYIKKEITNG